MGFDAPWKVQRRMVLFPPVPISFYVVKSTTEIRDFDSTHGLEYFSKHINKFD